MKILGINGSPRKKGTTGKVLQTILDATGMETELIHLGGKKIQSCISCTACAKNNKCILKDDMVPIREKLIEADAFVFGGANYYGMVNGLMHSFMERFYQFYHLDGKQIAGKPFVAVGTGGGDGKPALTSIEGLAKYNRLIHVGSMTVQGAVPCFTCGFGEECEVGGICRFFGKGTKITPEIIPALEKQPEAINEAKSLGQQLVDFLKNN